MKKKLILLLTCVFTLLFSVVAQAESVPVILYHNITDSALKGDQAPLLHTTKDDFVSQIKGLKEAGFQTITLDDYYDFVKGVKILPTNPVIITFDDGYLSNYKYAYPVLKELGMKATIFVVTSNMPGAGNTVYPHFSWEQAKEMVDSGVMIIGSHTHTHQALTQISYGSMVYELRRSKYLLETNLGLKNVHISLPYGGFDDLSLNTTIRSGYKTVCLVGDKGVNSKDGSIYGIKRLTVRGDMTPGDVINMINAEKGTN